MTDHENLSIERSDGVLVCRISRPAVMNALSGATLRELDAVFADAAVDDTIGACILIGGETGKKPAFAAGADIAEMSRMSGLELREHSRLGQRAFDRIERCPKPVIAAVDGFALGGGCELAMACHIRIASDRAKLGQPEITLGIIPGFGGTQRLVRLVGRGRGLELLLTGDMVGGERACELGLVDRVVPSGELFGAAMELAGRLAKAAPVARALILDAVVRGQDMNFDDAQRVEADLFGVVGATDDVREGLTAFLEKRKAEFKGK